ncbi:hypothetical protein B0H17DRAFT_1145704 [Mycena rosella]|uniref:Uncharacterized protein n=1 Tax=Mycena rosella TaxID=1033263 RepID=A0AAD7CQD4_MYCRO|nr:hypothetical protein B0H17DRAFT_1145704 [Mycena rosella]
MALLRRFYGPRDHLNKCRGKSDFATLLLACTVATATLGQGTRRRGYERSEDVGLLPVMSVATVQAVDLMIFLKKFARNGNKFARTTEIKKFACALSIKKSRESEIRNESVASWIYPIKVSRNRTFRDTYSDDLGAHKSVAKGAFSS